MKRIALFSTASALAALVAVGLAPAGSLSTGTATLHELEGSGIQGRIVFADDGTTLSVRGTASGLDPSASYVSLVYDNGSVPGGPAACEPTDDSLSFERMLLGAWVVAADGSGTLRSEKAGPAYAALTEFKTVSIRAAASFLRVACGGVAVNRRS